MTSEPKAFASLSSGLLARKGAARPAMRPQGFGQLGGALEDLGWNDMGFEAPKPAPVSPDDEHDAFGEKVAEHPVLHGHAGLTPIDSPVHSQQAEIAGRFVANSDEERVVEETAQFEGAPSADPIFVPEPAATPAPSATPRRAPKPRSAAGSKGKAAFTLRLDPQRHLRLRLACAVGGRSAQMLVTDALDRLLADMPEVEAMAGKANRKA